MTNNSQSPREYDAVLGGNSPPPIYGAVLGGIEGLKRRLETGNTQQRVDSLADAIKYGDAGIDLLIEALDDGEIEVRAKAFQLLQDVDSEKVRQIVNKGIPLKKGDKLYSVYASYIDYDDECYILVDSTKKVFTCYEEIGFQAIHLIARYVHKHEAVAVAEDLHKTILIGTKLSEFCRKYNLKLDEREIDQLKWLFDEAEGCINEFRFDPGLATISNLHDFCITNNIPLESRIGKEESWDFKDRILKYLKDTKNYDTLSLFFDFLQIGKFAFVEEEIVNEEAYLK